MNLNDESSNADNLWKNFSQETLRNEFADIVKDIPFLSSEAKRGGEFTQHLFHRLNIALENAVACTFLARMGLGIPLTTVTRSIFESLISTYWASLSDDNATILIEAEHRELLRLLRNNLQEGRGKTVNKETGIDETASFLKDPKLKEARKPPSFSKMAEAAGIKNVYDMFYGLLSVYAHGHATKLISEDLYIGVRDGTNESNIAALSLMHGCLKSIRLIAVNKIRENRQTRIQELETILGIKLTS